MLGINKFNDCYVLLCGHTEIWGNLIEQYAVPLLHAHKDNFNFHLWLQQLNNTSPVQEAVFPFLGLSSSVEALSLEKQSNIQLHTIQDLIRAGKKRRIYRELSWGQSVAVQLIGYLMFISCITSYYSVQYSCTANNQGICLLLSHA